MKRLQWKNLLLEDRRKNKIGKKEERSNTKGNRTQIERDFDRILFASPTRRLADKTQVFPLDSHDSVRTRLTHSHEVSNLARSIGMSLAFNFPREVFGENHAELEVQRKIPALLAATGLVHDLGNPPFGHQGEIAVQEWFKKKQKKWLKNKEGQIPNVPEDFLQFDGNPQTFRLLTRLQILSDEYGLNLTYATLAALVKYPSTASTHNQSGYKKFGVFESERSIFEDVWEKTGLTIGHRHPLAHVMESCDDIAYAVIDTEDTVKKGFASFYDLMDHLSAESEDSRVRNVIQFATKHNSDFKKEGLSSRELNDISMQMFRVQAIYELVDSATNAFVENIEQILCGEIDNDFELLKHSDGRTLCKTLKNFGRRHGYQNKQVLELELKGHNHIIKTMDMLWDAIHDKEKPFSRYARSTLSENYLRAYDMSEMPGSYKLYQLLADSMSGMTDSFLLNIHDHLKPLHTHE